MSILTRQSPGRPPAVQPEPQPAAPLVDAPLLHVHGLHAAGPRGTVFADVRFELAAGQRLVVLGRSGSGRSALLLALAGRLKEVGGHGWLAGIDLIGESRRIRQRVAVARIGSLIEVEPQLTVAESAMERALTEGVRVSNVTDRIAEIGADLGLDVEPDALVGELSRLDQGRLALALACLRPADLIVFDDLDRDLDLDEQRQLYAATATVASTGRSVALTTVVAETIPDDPAGVVVLRLADARS